MPPWQDHHVLCTEEAHRLRDFTLVQTVAYGFKPVASARLDVGLIDLVAFTGHSHAPLALAGVAWH